MINTLKMFDELNETMESSAARKIAEVIGKVFEDLRNNGNERGFS